MGALRTKASIEKLKGVQGQPRALHARRGAVGSLMGQWAAQHTTPDLLDLLGGRAEAARDLNKHGADGIIKASLDGL